MKQGEGDSSGAQSVLSVIPEQEIHMMIQEVQALDEEALKVRIIIMILLERPPSTLKEVENETYSVSSTSTYLAPHSHSANKVKLQHIFLCSVNKLI